MAGLAERVQRVQLLLETLNDPYPTPRSALRSDSGPAASRYVPCETCKRSGWLRRCRDYVVCLACDGRGWRRRQHDEQEWDAYLSMPVTEAVQLPVEAPYRPREDVGDESPYQWERLRVSYERGGSYRELRTRLAQLGTVALRRQRLIRRVLVDHEPIVLGHDDRLQLQLGVVWITLRMRSVRVPPWLMEHEQQQQNDLVRALAGAGFKPAAIAVRLGIEREVVKRVLRQAKQRRPAEAGRMIAVTSGPAGLVSA